MKASELILPVSRWLSDQLPGDEYARWTETDLFDAFKWAVQFIASCRPDAFSKVVDVTLEPGTLQTLPSCCNRITDTLDNAIPVSRRSGRLVDESRLCRTRPNSRLGFRVTEYTYSEDSPSNVYVYPPVPNEAAGGTFGVICQYDPDPKDVDEELPVRPSLRAPVFSLMVVYIASGENESASLERAVKQHYAQAALALQIEHEEIKTKLAVNQQEETHNAR